MFPQCNEGAIENRFLGYCQPDIFGQIGGKLLLLFSPTRPSEPGRSSSRNNVRLMYHGCPLSMQFFSMSLIGPQIT